MPEDIKIGAALEQYYQGKIGVKEFFRQTKAATEDSSINLTSEGHPVVDLMIQDVLSNLSAIKNWFLVTTGLRQQPLKINQALELYYQGELTADEVFSRVKQ